jgi:hypothetical protein
MSFMPSSDRVELFMDLALSSFLTATSVIRRVELSRSQVVCVVDRQYVL